MAVQQQRQTRQRDRRMLFATSFLTVVLLLVLAVPNVISVIALRIGTKISTETSPLIFNAQRVFNLMVDQESGERGYIITGDEKFLEPYIEATVRLKDLWPQTEALAEKVGGEAPKLIQAVETAAIKWQTEVAMPEIALVKSNRDLAAQQAVESGNGKQLFDAFRTEANALISYAEQRRNSQTEQRNELLATLNIILVILGILGLIGLATIYYISQMSRRYQEEAAHSEAVSRAKDDFLSIASHELKTPITSIKGYSQAALRRARRVDGSNPSADEWGRTVSQLVVIEQQSSRLARMVDDLLDVSRMQGGRLELNYERGDIVALTQRVVEQLQATTPRHVISLSSEPPCIEVLMDEARIEQVLYNLLNNAVKYSPEGMEIKVKLRVDEGEVICAVKDEGIGIPKEEQGRLFSRFYRASNATATKISGVGLGLFIAGGIIERHGGRLWLDSAPGHGSTFYFSLPLGGN